MQAHSKPARSGVRAALRSIVTACARTGKRPAAVALPACTVHVRRNRRH